MIHLIYGSSATNPMTEAEILELLAKARTKNEHLGVTGLLLYHGGNFLQVLEGEEQTVMDLFETIKKDARHHSVLEFTRYPVPERRFKQWEMGFVNVQTVPKEQLAGYSHFLDNSVNNREAAEELSRADVFLSVFKASIR